MHIRRFSSDLKTKIPGGHPGLYGVPIQFDRAHLPTQNLEELAQRLNGLPFLLNRPMIVVAMYLEPQGAMDEHPADEPILFLVTAGRGFVRIGGPAGETQPVTAGDAVLWPARLDHKVWTEDEPLEAILIHGPAEREEAPLRERRSEQEEPCCLAPKATLLACFLEKAQCTSQDSDERVCEE